jgi:hypothetical protein
MQYVEECGAIHPPMVFQAITVQETQFWILKQNGCQSAMV